MTVPRIFDIAVKCNTFSNTKIIGDSKLFTFKFKCEEAIYKVTVISSQSSLFLIIIS
jgi:hypothetical protein